MTTISSAPDSKTIEQNSTSSSNDHDNSELSNEITLKKDDPVDVSTPQNTIKSFVDSHEECKNEISDP